MIFGIFITFLDILVKYVVGLKKYLDTMIIIYMCIASSFNENWYPSRYSYGYSPWQYCSQRPNESHLRFSCDANERDFTSRTNAE